MIKCLEHLKRNEKELVLFKKLEKENTTKSQHRKDKEKRKKQFVENKLDGKVINLENKGTINDK